jgi:hypothetical protein
MISFIVLSFLLKLVSLLDPQSADRRDFKTRPRRQHERSHRHADLSVFTVAGGRIVSGWQRRNAVTIDTEDIAFRRALEPSARRARQSPNQLFPSELPRTRRPSRQALRSPINRTGSSSTLRVANPTPDEETRHRIVVDFDIPPLPPGKVYTASSYLGKGWLYELLSIASGTPPSIHLPPLKLMDIGYHPYLRLSIIPSSYLIHAIRLLRC